ncbi:hypothetical protein TVAG_184960 [Trichomonas vaginalis G3]|uniref:DUF3447 domain-containing protein n=1 Tax=Trichomonas vaginalis (strain ATCC PRA-98 / G3) TaxID=412133 RepID=A2D8E1_TRIV3|nr:spectrin binding [Trichomonas vaginalis G3]EAY23190.1 hypothetical protein TVAG_184960 [Trichomonas vaginalis G3]KAI5534160.1 spectrin binding [Trichomonas vaginalis G3]|eukprot:XP_001584176.1 hypothetical protein [Trichomonas vaginalis G3]
MEDNQAYKHYEILMDKYKGYIETVDAIYRLDSDKINSTAELYKEIKDNLIDAGYFTAQKMMDTLNSIGQDRLRYRHAYVELMNRIYQEYHCDINPDNLTLSNYDTSITNTYLDAILKDDEESLSEFLKHESLNLSDLLKTCCFHGAFNCFNLLRTEFKVEITKECLDASFRGDNQYIINECLKEQKPDSLTYNAAIASHNTENILKLIDEFNTSLYIGSNNFHNLHSFLIYLNQTNDFNTCFVFSPYYRIPSLCEYLHLNGIDINANCSNYTALHLAVYAEETSIIKYLIMNGINIDETCTNFGTALNLALSRNLTDIVELLVSNGANINIKDEIDNMSALQYGIINNNKKVVDILISHGADPNEKN